METLAGFNADMDPRNRRTAMDVMAERGLADQPKREGSVPLALQGCADQVGVLSNAILQLRGRLDPVLRAQPPANAQKESVEPSAPCVIATGIEVQTRRLVELRRTVEDLLDRLEL